jgi:aminomethyltransferase
MKTPLYDAHLAHGAKMVPFAGWEMPLHFGSQLEEHHRVRRASGVFDVSHMTQVDLEGSGAEAYLRRLLANDVAKLQAPGAALYSCMLNEHGGILDDLIVYRRDTGRYRVVANAATRDQDLAWMEARARDYDVRVTERIDLAMLAVQGPAARDRLLPLLPAVLREAAGSLAPFHCAEYEALFIARTGYTGEDGFELILPGTDAAGYWAALLAAGVSPCGLGARDTLRLEAGMHLYGTDMDSATHPLESGLGWTVSWEPAAREFIGRAALETARQDPACRRFVGLVLHGRGVLRNGLRVDLADGRHGTITSGSFAPTLGCSVALARLPVGDDATARVMLHGKAVEVTVVKPPFVRHGRSCLPG